MAGTITPTPWFTGLDDDGSVLVGGLLYTYYAGLLVPLPTYSDVDLTVLNANPIVLDAAGRATIFLSSVSSIKYILKRSNGTTVRTADNIAPIPSSSGAYGDVFIFGGDNNSPITLTAYPSGATFDKLHAGTAPFDENSANLAGTYILEATLMAGGGTVTLGLVNLDDGAPDTAIVEVSSTSATGQLRQSSSITFAAAGSSKKYGVKAKVSAGTGYVWGARIRKVL